MPDINVPRSSPSRRYFAFFLTPSTHSFPSPLFSHRTQGLPDLHQPLFSYLWKGRDALSSQVRCDLWHAKQAFATFFFPELGLLFLVTGLVEPEGEEDELDEACEGRDHDRGSGIVDLS